MDELRKEIDELKAQIEVHLKTIADLRKQIQRHVDYENRRDRWNRDHLPYEDDPYDR